MWYLLSGTTIDLRIPQPSKSNDSGDSPVERVVSKNKGPKQIPSAFRFRINISPKSQRYILDHFSWVVEVKFEREVQKYAKVNKDPDP